MAKKEKKFSLLKLLLFVLVCILLFFLVTTLFNTKNTNTTPEVDNTVDNGDNNDNNQESGDNTTRDRYGFYNGYGNSYSSSWKLASNVGKLDTNVANNVRAKRTKILGNNQDVMTILVYMCGSDLESQAAMGVYDLQEMAQANISKNINLIVYTGGTTKWHTSDISTRYNQIYQVHSGGLQRLVENAGTGSMVDPETLVSFIEWGVDNFEANRYALIMWDHGGGSVSGYGHDEKYPNLGSMDLAEIDEALTEADVQFDFIGFDACLMANTETALMVAEHADYLIASEESEPGIGWYYTDWLNALSKNTSMPTIEIGKNIADSFVNMCKAKTPQQSATLSVIDLAEVQDILPAKLSAFSRSATNMLAGNQFKTIANARSASREFAANQYLDLVDLVDLASGVGTPEAKDLVNALMSCVKYNNTSRDMANSYGLSIYFPYRNKKYINTVLNTYNKMDMNPEYMECVRNFAQYATAGQVSSGGSHNAYQSYNNYNTDSYYSNQSSAELIIDLLDLFINGSYSNNNSYSSYYGSALDLLFGGRSLDRNVAEYIANNHFDADLTFKDGKIAISDEQWSLIDLLKLNAFIDDGSGYIDLGKDNVFEIDDNGNLLAVNDLTWLAASNDNTNWQVIPYYFLYQIEDGDNLISYGRVPVLLNDKYANLIVYIDDESMEVVGATYDYKDESDVVAKNLTELAEGDVIEFVCDYYDYDGNYTASYKLGDKLTITDNIYLGDVDISDYKYLASYELVDIYQQSYWTTTMN